MKHLFLSSVAILAFSSVASFAPQAAQAQLRNPCPWTNDGECDEPQGRGLCAPGTDVADCSPSGRQDNSCQYANDGECDDASVAGHITGLCRPGTDTADCSRPAQTGANSCRYANDGECDDPTVPGHVSRECQPGTDTNDCSGTAPVAQGGGATYAPWYRMSGDFRQNTAQPGGAAPLVVYGGRNFVAGPYTIYHGITDGARPGSVVVTVFANSVTLESNTRYRARASASGAVFFEPEGLGTLITYEQPGPGRAMIYARNDDTGHARAICVVPAGWSVSQCGN